jgi:hypothetical protein
MFSKISYISIFIACLANSAGPDDFLKFRKANGPFFPHLNQKPCDSPLINPKSPVSFSSLGGSFSGKKISDDETLSLLINLLGAQAPAQAQSMELRLSDINNYLSDLRAYLKKHPSRFFRNLEEEDKRINVNKVKHDAPGKASLAASIFFEESSLVILSILPPDILKQYHRNEPGTGNAFLQKTWNHLFDHIERSNRKTTLFDINDNYDKRIFKALAEHMIFIADFHKRASTYQGFVSPMTIHVNRMLALAFSFQAIKFDKRYRLNADIGGRETFDELYASSREEKLQLLQAIHFLIKFIDNHPNEFVWKGAPENICPYLLGSMTSVMASVLLAVKDDIKTSEYKDYEALLLKLEPAAKRALNQLLPGLFPNFADLSEGPSKVGDALSSNSNSNDKAASRSSDNKGDESSENITPSSPKDEKREYRAEKNNVNKKGPRKTKGGHGFSETVEKMKLEAGKKTVDASNVLNAETQIRKVAFRNSRVSKALQEFESQGAHRKRAYEAYLSWKSLIETHGLARARTLPSYPQDRLLQIDKYKTRRHRIRLNNVGDRLIYSVDEGSGTVFIEAVVESHDYGVI